MCGVSANSPIRCRNASAGRRPAPRMCARHVFESSRRDAWDGREVPSNVAPFEKLSGWRESLRRECKRREERMQVAAEAMSEPGRGGDEREERHCDYFTFFLSLIELLPRTMILHPVSASNCLAVSPRGPRILPTKLYCGHTERGNC